MEPNRLDAKEAARLIERGELSAETLIASCLERIAAREPEVRAWAWLDEKQVFSQLEAVRAPMYGMPVA